MADLQCASSAANKIRLYVEWSIVNKTTASLDFVRCENDHERSCTYQLMYRGSLVDSRTFPGLTVTREPLPTGVTTRIIDGQPDVSDVGIQYSGPAE